jgi:membrane protein YdbS with pleckstrin-like domain
MTAVPPTCTRMTTTAIKSVNLALAFLLELILLAAVAYSAFHLHVPTGVKWLLATASLIALAAIWSVIAAPTAKRRLPPTPLVCSR